MYIGLERQLTGDPATTAVLSSRRTHTLFLAFLGTRHEYGTLVYMQADSHKEKKKTNAGKIQVLVSDSQTLD